MDGLFFIFTYLCEKKEKKRKKRKKKEKKKKKGNKSSHSIKYTLLLHIVVYYICIVEESPKLIKLKLVMKRVKVKIMVLKRK